MGLSKDSVGLKAVDLGLAIKKTRNSDRVIALGGNPNVGKSTVFNGLTGLRQHTGNWPGKTVAGAQGYCTYKYTGYIVVDLPGCYSLMAHSTEEEVARDFICFGGADAVIIVCDATCLERSMNLVLQTMEIADNVVVCVNLMDEAKKKGIKIDLQAISKKLGVPVIGTAARSKKGMDDLMDAVSQTIHAADQAINPTVAQTIGRATGQTTDRATDQTTDRATGQTINHATGQTTDRATGQTTDHAIGQATGQTADQATGQTTDQATGQTTDQATGQTTANATGKPINHAANRLVHKAHTQYPSSIETAISRIEPQVKKICGEAINSRWLSLMLLQWERDTHGFIEQNIKSRFLTDAGIAQTLADIRKEFKNQGITERQIKDDIVASIVRKAEEICKNTVIYENENYHSRDSQIDHILTGKWTAFPIMLLALLGVFWLTITGANYPSRVMGDFLFRIEEQLLIVLKWVNVPQFFSEMLVLGIYRVLAWVVSVMLPPMAIFFPLFTLLEDVGFLPRVAFNLDKCFKKCSACGKQALTMCMRVLNL